MRCATLEPVTLSPATLEPVALESAIVQADRAADAGIFSPSSVTWHLHADPAMWIGGISALYLQALHPLAALGIVQNSAFEDDPFSRLVATGSFIVATTWGTTVQAERAGERVRAVHARLLIREHDTGRVHRLDAPDLLLWVHCALVRSNLHAVERGGLTLPADLADRYVREQRRTAELVGLPATDVPGSKGELLEYLLGMRPALAASNEASTIRRFLLRPTLHGWTRAARPAWTAASRLGYSVMPPWAHELYGHRALPAPAATAALRAARSAALLIPRRIRLGFPEPYLCHAIAALGESAIPAGRRLHSRVGPL